MALVYKKLGMFAFVEMLIFLAILGVGYAYVWLKGDLDWDKPEPIIPVIRHPAVEIKPAAEEAIV